MPKTEFLVVDTSAFIKNTQLQDFSEKVITCQEVVDEIKNSRQLRRLVVLPFDLEIDEPDNEDIVFVSQFSKKTGDYPALSATDIKVMALTYKLERLKVGKDHLNSEPPAPREVQAVDHSVINDKNIVGFYSPDGNPEEESVVTSWLSSGGELFRCKDIIIRPSREYGSQFVSRRPDDDVLTSKALASSTQPASDDRLLWKEDSEEAVGAESNDDEEDERKESESEDEETSDDEFFDTEQEVPEVDDELINRLSEIKVQACNVPGEECDQNDPCAVDNDDAGWITPSNLKKNIQQLYGDTTDDGGTPIKVACLTTDFAMQNVLKQIGLNIISLDGLLIKQVRTWILRCYACFKTTPDMTRVFCRNCGHKTLKRVAVTVDPDGKQHLHINFRRPLTARGKRFPIPRFRGGKHSNNPVLSEDQRVPQQRLSILARKKTDALNPDYIAGLSPFIMRDVCSKSAMLGIANKETKSWERRNPNVVVKRRRKK